MACYFQVAFQQGKKKSRQSSRNLTNTFWMINQFNLKIHLARIINHNVINPIRKESSFTL